MSYVKRLHGQPWLQFVRSILFKVREQCEYCGRRLTWAESTLDHLVPRSKGGTNDASNLFLACRRCNSAKGNLDPERYYRVDRHDVFR